MKESTLRDLIAQDISKLKRGLTLLKKEQYIPNKYGTRGFIDLYAKDEANRHVLIEIKTSDAVSRQAIHEVNKYVEGVKQHFATRETEIHVIIASTEWSELFVPFSHFASDASFSVEGLEILMSEDDTDFQVKPIIPTFINQGRFIAPWHLAYWYKDKAALEKGVSELASSFSQKGIENYIIAKLHIQNHTTAEERKDAMRKSVAQIIGVSESSILELPEVPVYEYIAYVALQILSEDECLKILSQDKEEFDAVQELLPDLEEEEVLCYLHESVIGLKPYPRRDYCEIGYPAKFNMIIESDDCSECTLIRHGTFERNHMLSDEILLAELRGEDGSTKSKLKRIVNMNEIAHIKSLKDDVDATLRYNPVWRSHILKIIDEIQREYHNAEIELWIYNPSKGVFTIYYALTKEDGFLYVPTYHIIVRNPDVVRVYYGAIEEAGTSMSFSQVLQKYYDGGLEALLYSVTWGGTDLRDSDIIEDLGAQYRSYRVDIYCENREYFSLRDEKWRNCNPCDPLSLFKEYINKNEELVRQIVKAIGQHDMGSFYRI